MITTVEKNNSIAPELLQLFYSPYKKTNSVCHFGLMIWLRISSEKTKCTIENLEVYYF